MRKVLFALLSIVMLLTFVTFAFAAETLVDEDFVGGIGMLDYEEELADAIVISFEEETEWYDYDLPANHDIWQEARDEVEYTVGRHSSSNEEHERISRVKEFLKSDANKRVYVSQKTEDGVSVLSTVLPGVFNSVNYGSFTFWGQSYEFTLTVPESSAYLPLSFVLEVPPNSDYRMTVYNLWDGYIYSAHTVQSGGYETVVIDGGVPAGSQFIVEVFALMHDYRDDGKSFALYCGNLWRGRTGRVSANYVKQISGSQTQVAAVLYDRRSTDIPFNSKTESLYIEDACAGFNYSNFRRFVMAVDVAGNPTTFSYTYPTKTLKMNGQSGAGGRWWYYGAPAFGNNFTWYITKVGIDFNYPVMEGNIKYVK